MYASTMTNNNKVKDKIHTDLDKNSLQQQYALTSWLLWETLVRMATVILKPRDVLLAATELTDKTAMSWFSFPDFSKQ